MLLSLIFKIIVTTAVLSANYLLRNADLKGDIYMKIFVVIGLVVALLIEIIAGTFFMGKTHVTLLASTSLALFLSAVFPFIQFFVKIARRIQKGTLERMRVSSDAFYQTFLGLCYFGITAAQLILIWMPAVLF